MALTDPELELLRELLEEDPGSEVFVQVGEELVRRAAWGEAVRVLVAGLEAEPEESEGWGLLAEAAFRDGQHLRALGALERLGEMAEAEPDLARIQIQAYARSGQTDKAIEAARAFGRLHGRDAEIDKLKERLIASRRAPGEDDGPRRALDPFVSAVRAEQYLIAGRPDRAVRAYRRILFYNPGDSGLAARLRELLDDPSDPGADDLSEELPDPSVVPPELVMPTPALFGLKPSAPEPLPIGVANGAAGRARADAPGPPTSAVPSPEAAISTGDDELTEPSFSADEVLQAVQRVLQDRPRPRPEAEPDLTPVAAPSREGEPDENTDPGYWATDPGLTPAPVVRTGLPDDGSPTPAVPRGTNAEDIERVVRKRRSLIRR